MGEDLGRACVMMPSQAGMARRDFRWCWEVAEVSSSLRGRHGSGIGPSFCPAHEENAESIGKAVRRGQRKRIMGHSLDKRPLGGPYKQNGAIIPSVARGKSGIEGECCPSRQVRAGKWANPGQSPFGEPFQAANEGKAAHREGRRGVHAARIGATP